MIANKGRNGSVRSPSRLSYGLVVVFSELGEDGDISLLIFFDGCDDV